MSGGTRTPEGYSPAVLETAAIAAMRRSYKTDKSVVKD